MAVWGEVYAFELPFFLFWKNGFVSGRVFCADSAQLYPVNERIFIVHKSRFLFEEDGFILWASYASGRRDLPSKRKIDHE